MAEIKGISKLATYGTLIICLLMFILTWMTFRIRFISIIPNLFGDGSSLAANAVQSLIILGLAVMSAASMGNFKLGNAIMFLIYFAILVGTFFSPRADDIFSVLLSIAGMLLTYRAPGAFLDYNALSSLEGFPHFSDRYTYQVENREYVSMYEEAYHNTKNCGMDAPTPIAAAEEKVKEKPENGYMDEI